MMWRSAAILALCAVPAMAQQQAICDGVSCWTLGSIGSGSGSITIPTPKTNTESAEDICQNHSFHDNIGKLTFKEPFLERCTKVMEDAAKSKDEKDSDALKALGY